MTYVDLNPVRVGIATNIETSRHTSLQTHVDALRDTPEKANQQLRPIVGRSVFRLPMTEPQYIHLVAHRAADPT